MIWFHDGGERSAPYEFQGSGIWVTRQVAPKPVTDPELERVADALHGLGIHARSPLDPGGLTFEQVAAAAGTTVEFLAAHGRWIYPTMFALSVHRQGERHPANRAVVWYSYSPLPPSTPAAVRAHSDELWGMNQAAAAAYADEAEAAGMFGFVD